MKDSGVNLDHGAEAGQVKSVSAAGVVEVTQWCEDCEHYRPERLLSLFGILSWPAATFAKCAISNCSDSSFVRKTLAPVARGLLLRDRAYCATMRMYRDVSCEGYRARAGLTASTKPATGASAEVHPPKDCDPLETT